MVVTLSLEDEVVRKVEHLAAEHETTVAALVQDYLVNLARADEAETAKRRNLAMLERSFERFSIDASPRAWTRADLYERG